MARSEEYRAWRRSYDKRWVAAKRQRCFAYLGSACVKCGSVKDLEFDHVEAGTKSFTIAGNLNRRWTVLVAELDKCQLLCVECHRLKSKLNGETGGGQNKINELPHGTPTGYRSPWNCRCTECSDAQRAYKRKYQKSSGTSNHVTADVVTAIRMGHESGKTYSELAAEFKLHKASIWRICTYRTHKNIRV